MEARQNFDTFYEKLIRRYYITGARNRLVLATKYPNPRCASLYEHMRPAPDGNILICRSDLTAVGNIVEDGFRNVWYGERANQLRQLVNNCKGCWYACESIPSGIYSRDVFAFKLRELLGKTPKS